MLTSIFHGLNKSKAGTITSSCNIVSAVGTPFIGLLIDKIGGRYIYIYSHLINLRELMIFAGLMVVLESQVVLITLPQEKHN